MKTESLELYIVLMRILEQGPFKDVAKQLKDKLEDEVNDTRVDFLGQKHERDLDNYIARYPNIKYSGCLLARKCHDILHKQKIQTIYTRRSNNIFHRIRDRILNGPVPIARMLPTDMYTRYSIHRRIMGHLAAAYCVCFDHTGQFIFTGSDDHLIKIWCSRTGRLLRTLRGHKGEVCDMSVNYENRLLASAGTDKIIRIWDLKTTKLLECISSHQALVTSVKFSPYNRHGDDRFLVSTSNDGTIAIWKYHVERFGFERVIKVRERNKPKGQITCSSISTGGVFLACGSSDNYIHVYGFPPENSPYWIAELNLHTDDVDSVQFCNTGLRFVSGSKDGRAIIWTFKRGRWKPLILNMDTQLDQRILIRPKKEKPPVVLMVQWSRDDKYVMTSLVDYSIKVWNSYTGKLVHILREHRHDIYFIESHPYDPRIFLSGSHDGTCCIWDIEQGKCLKRISNIVDPNKPIDDHNMPCIHDIKFSPDGSMFATTDSGGYLTLYGTGGSHLYQKIPDQMFFSTDYGQLIFDVSHFSMDEATHMAPYQMPKPLLVDMNGYPYPKPLQSLVTDYQCGQRPVIPEMPSNQLANLASIYRKQSEFEDEIFIREKQIAAQRLQFYGPNNDTDSDATIIDSDATEIDDDYSYVQPSFAYHHNLRSRNLYGAGHSSSSSSQPERRTRSYNTRLRCNKRMRR